MPLRGVSQLFSDTCGKKGAVRETGRGSKGKKKGRENTRSLADFGFNSEHIPLLEGATYPPERRTGLLRGLGPGTLAVIALHETEYADKPLAALKESIKMLGMADSIIQVLKNKPKEGVQDMLRALMDVLLLTTARTTHRMYLPIIVFYRFVVYLDTTKQNNLFGFSDAPALGSLQKFLKGFGFQMRSQASADHLSQVVFHAMYGTVFDCLKLLGQITTKPLWVNREAIGDKLQRKGVNTIVQFTPIRLVVVSKMSRAMQTKSIGAAEPCNMTRSSFSGRKRQFSQAFEEYIQSGGSAVSYTANPASLAHALCSEVVCEADPAASIAVDIREISVEATKVHSAVQILDPRTSSRRFQLPN